MNEKDIIATLHPLEIKVLPYLAKTNKLSELVRLSGLKEVEVMRALQWLSNKGILKINVIPKETISLDENGKIYAKEGLPEKRFLNSIKDKELSMDQIAKNAKLSREEIGVSLGQLKSKVAIELTPDKKIKITENGKKLLQKEFLEEKLLKKLLGKIIELKELKEEERFAVDVLKKRKGIIKHTTTNLRETDLLEEGKRIVKIKIKVKAQIEKVTPLLLKNNGWKDKNFRRYDLAINVPKITRGKKHFVRNATNYARKIWIELGFVEMHGDYVQTEFWDMDALFIPQDHPARSMQDTYYLKTPNKGDLPKVAKIVKEVHENGGNTGSTGWQAPWSLEKAKELLLRTHTTVLSAQSIHNLKEIDLPAKFFSVNRVFRNETLDWKHLFEFNQVEGIVVDKDANFSNLIGYLKDFFKKMGFNDIRIRPAHFPYTEPSAEIDVLHPTKNEWVELGGCGIFRPEVVKPLLGIEVPVLAWGFGLERIITAYYGITDLREIYKNDLDQLRKTKEWMK